MLLVSSAAFSAGLNVSPVKPAEPFIEAAFPDATSIGTKSEVLEEGDLAFWTIKKEDEVLGYAFETDDIALIPAYSGEPVNSLVLMDTEGKIVSVHVLEHHEPILLIGIPEHKLHTFTDQYSGFMSTDLVKIGGQGENNSIHIDGLSGATVTVMVVNLGIMRSAKEVAKHLGIIEVLEEDVLPIANIKQDVYQPANWTQLTGDGSIRRMLLKNSQVEDSFVGTDGELDTPLSKEEGDASFIDLYYTQLNIPTIGRNLLGDSEYEWLQGQLKEGEHALALMSNGFSFKGSGYVRGGIFDRIQIHQGDNVFSFRDLDQYLSLIHI